MQRKWPRFASVITLNRSSQKSLKCSCLNLWRFIILLIVFSNLSKPVQGIGCRVTYIGDLVQVASISNIKPIFFTAFNGTMLAWPILMLNGAHQSVVLNLEEKWITSVLASFKTRTFLMIHCLVLSTQDSICDTEVQLLQVK